MEGSRLINFEGGPRQTSSHFANRGEWNCCAAVGGHAQNCVGACDSWPLGGREGA